MSLLAANVSKLSKNFSQKNINNNLTSVDDYDFLDQIENGYIPMMKELPVSELRRKYKDNG